MITPTKETGPKVLRAFRDGGHREMEVLDQSGTITQGDPNALLRFAIR